MGETKYRQNKKKILIGVDEQNKKSYNLVSWN